MNFHEFDLEYANLSDEAFVAKIKKALQYYSNLPVSVLREGMDAGELGFLADLEADDAFGTEGMNL